MTAQTFSALRSVLSSWIKRYRLQRSARGLVYGLLCGSVFASFLGIYTYLSAKIIADEFLFTAVLISTFCTLSGGMLTYFWPVEENAIARVFDLSFDLKERMSTALELESSHVSVLKEDVGLDALRSAEGVNYKQHMPIKLPNRAFAAALILLAANAAFWFYSEDLFALAEQRRRVQSTIDEQAAVIEAIIEEIQTSPKLTEDNKASLLEPLNEALDQLNESETLEDAFSALAEAEESLKILEDSAANNLREALQQAGEYLSESDPEILKSFSENLANNNFGQSAENLKSLDLENIDSSELQTTAEQLDALADEVEAFNPELAQSLRQSAEALENQDAQTAQEALEQAAQALEALEQQLAASEAAQQAAGQLEQSQADIVSAGQQGEGNQQASNGEATSPGESQSEGSGEGQQSDTGDGQGTAENNQTSETGTASISQNNSPDGTGTSVFQPVSPSSIGGEGSDRVSLPPRGQEGDNITGTGQSNPGDTEPVTVPYTEVFPQYQNAANQAVDNGEIPPQYRDLVRDYFSSLEP